MNALFAAHALLPTGWASDVLLRWDEGGSLLQVESGATPDAGTPRAGGVLLPGLPNLHSHAFQRAFAGLTEYRGAAQDSFWTWRDLMYRFAGRVSPDALEDIATHLYVEMLAAGYTAVCEFHYVHHDPAGQPYADPAEMSLRLAAAARRAGIGLTMLPVLYQHSGFGAKAPRDDQRRFIGSVDGLLRIVESLRAQGVRCGVAPHSLRAVASPALQELLAGLDRIDASAPVHIHIAEQRQEVADCQAWSGQRPVQWLLDHAPVDARWCLVHATHLDEREREGTRKRGAVIGLCPSTEANLGDGVFDAAAWHGAWGIGSDSHASVDAAEELRLLEYTQRLATHQRNVLADAARPDVAETMWQTAVAGGAQAAARPIDGLAPGRQADFVVLGDRLLDGLTPAQQLASHVFASHRRNTVQEVWVGGRRRVQNGQHPGAATAAERFVAARRRLLSELG
jgi:formimidoylglutamate deiminase